MDAAITFVSEQVLTQEEFFQWVRDRPGHDINHYELIHGRIVMSPPAGMAHASTGAHLTTVIKNHVDRYALGIVLDSSAGYDLPSGDTLEPDVSFISRERLAAAPLSDPERFARVVPDLVVEILSRSTAKRDRTEKKSIYAANGVREYWIVDGSRREVTVFVLAGSDYGPEVAVTAGRIASAVLPHLKLTVDELFRGAALDHGSK